MCCVGCGRWVKALHAEREEERGRAFVWSAPVLAGQVATSLRCLYQVRLNRPCLGGANRFEFLTF
jgi:hypothetical protein